jgi:multidrug efflux system outer membrane protein
MCMPMRRQRRPSWVGLGSLVFLTLFALFSGCKLAVPPTQRQVLENALAATTIIPPRWTAPADTNAVANDWLKTFDDPQLEALVAEAMTHNTDLRAAAERVEAARQLVVVGSQLLPVVGVRLGAGATRDAGNKDWGTGTTAYAGIAWEPDVWGRLRAQKDATRAAYEATALEYAWARQSLVATTAKAWFLATGTRQLFQLAGQAVGIYANLLALVKTRRAAGKVTDLDVAEAGANLHTAQAQLRTAEAADLEARRALELLLWAAIPPRKSPWRPTIRRFPHRCVRVCRCRSLSAAPTCSPRRARCALPSAAKRRRGSPYSRPSPWA